MTRGDIIRMAREADLIDNTFASDWYIYQLERFATLVAAAEREACAKLCDWLNGEKRLTPAGCAALIRARSQQ